MERTLETFPDFSKSEKSNLRSYRTFLPSITAHCVTLRNVIKTEGRQAEQLKTQNETETKNENENETKNENKQQSLSRNSQKTNET